MQSKREFIRLHWHNVVCSLVDRLFSAEKWRVEIVGTDRRIIWATTTDTESAAWDAAHAYTLEHIEAVRQLREEIAVLVPFAKGRTEESLSVMPLWAKDSIPSLLAEGAAINRTIERLESALADKLRGTREGQ